MTLITKQGFLKYRADTSHLQIEKVYVTKESEHCVWLPPNKPGDSERKVYKVGADWQYFDSWEDAHNYLMQSALTLLDNCRRTLQRAQDRVGRVKGLRQSRETAPCH